MNTAEDDVGTARTRELSDLVATQGIRGMDPDADDIARSQLRGVKGIQRFIRDDRIAPSLRRGGREHIQPPRRNHSRPEGCVARID